MISSSLATAKQGNPELRHTSEILVVTRSLGVRPCGSFPKSVDEQRQLTLEACEEVLQELGVAAAALKRMVWYIAEGEAANVEVSAVMSDWIIDGAQVETEFHFVDKMIHSGCLVELDAVAHLQMATGQCPIEEEGGQKSRILRAW